MKFWYIILPVLWLALIVWNVWKSHWNAFRQMEIYREDIRMVLEKYHLNLVSIRKPTLKERFYSYPYNFVAPVVFINGIPIRFEHEVTFKVSFSNHFGKKCEVWLQIRKNNFTGKVKYDWCPALKYFEDVPVDLVY